MFVTESYSYVQCFKTLTDGDQDQEDVEAEDQDQEEVEAEDVLKH